MKNLIILVLTVTLLFVNTLLQAQCYDLSTGADTMGFENNEMADFNLWKIDDTNGNDTTWERSTIPNAYTGDYMIIIRQYNEDWLFSKCFEFDTGKFYDIKFWYNMRYPEVDNQDLMICIGNDTNSNSMNDTIYILNDIEWYAYYWSDTILTFKVSYPDNYYIGWYASGPTYYPVTGIYMDDIIVREHDCSSLSVELGNDTTICAGDSLLLDAGSGFENYSWSTGADSETIKVDSGIFYVEVTDQYGCIAYDTITVDYYYLPNDELIIEDDTVFCLGDSVVLSIELENANCNDYHIYWFQNYYFWNIDSINTIKTTDFYTYIITDTNSKCYKYSDTIWVTAKEPFSNEEICLVTLDDEGYNKIVWEKTSGKRTKEFKIYRESYQADSFGHIGTVAFNSMSTFTDTTSEPEKRFYRYKISVIDSCDNESSLSGFHITLHLSINGGMGNNINLSWNHYYGFWYNTYRIYRGTDPDSMSQIDSLPYTNSTYTDTDPPQGDVYYQIEAKRLVACNPTRGEYCSTLSNFVDNKNISLKNNDWDSDINIYPNPFTTTINLEIKGFNENEETIFELYNTIGNKVFSKSINSNGLFSIDVSMLAVGVYLCRVVNNNNLIRKQIIKL
ncbi:MAG: T9SS type A sorting domain-containing protein [Bacteroidota bacterium]|nr:T9SS type A sorting domain-containing protein [Bacteroidota bacterium]